MNKTLFVLIMLTSVISVAAEEQFDLGDLIELLALMPHIFQALGAIVEMFHTSGVLPTLLFLFVSFSIGLIVSYIFQPCLNEFSKKKYQPLRTGVLLTSNNYRN